MAAQMDVDKYTRMRDIIAAKMFTDGGKIRDNVSPAIRNIYYSLDKKVKAAQLRVHKEKCATRAKETAAKIARAGLKEGDTVYYRARNATGTLVIDEYGYMLLRGERSVALYPYALPELVKIGE